MFTKKTTALATILLLAAFTAPGQPYSEPPNRQEDNMAIKLKTWVQTKFTRPNVTLFTKDGDYYGLDGLIPSRDTLSIERMPSWTGHIDFVTDFETPGAAVYDYNQRHFVFIGTSTAEATDRLGTMHINHDDLSAGAVTSHASTAPAALGGNHKQNALYVLNSFWWIGSDQDVYACASVYGGTRYNWYTGEDAISLIPIRDTMFLVNDSDEVYEWDYDTTTFDLYYDSELLLDVKNAFHFRDKIVLFSRHNDGSLAIYLLDDTPPVDIRQLLFLPHETGAYLPDAGSATYGTPWAIHDDDLFFSPGLYWSDESDAEVVPLWRFDGNSIEPVDYVDAPIVPNAWGLTTWRGRLLLYFVNNSAQHIYLMQDGRFTQILDAAYTTSNWSDLYSLGGELWLPRQDSGTEGWTRLDDYEDGVFTSSWLDMDHPGSEKHLSRLACVLSDAAADFNVKIEYRTESGSWTEAVTEDNARHVDAGNLGVAFYLLQVRITLDDNTGNNEDISLQSLAATYSYGVD